MADWAVYSSSNSRSEAGVQVPMRYLFLGLIAALVLTGCQASPGAIVFNLIVAPPFVMVILWIELMKLFMWLLRKVTGKERRARRL